MSKNLKKVIVSGRFAFVHMEPHSINGGEKRYGLCLIISKSDLKIEEIKKAIEVSKEEAILKYCVKPEDIKTPLKDGDVDFIDNEAFKNSYYINCNSKIEPQVINRKRNLISKDEIYSGAYGYVSMVMYSYIIPNDDEPIIGVAAGLNNILKTEDGEKLISRMDAVDEFSEIEDDILD